MSFCNRITCVECVTVDPVYQHVLDKLVEAWDNVGYHIDSSILCPLCGKRTEEIEE